MTVKTDRKKQTKKKSMEMLKTNSQENEKVIDWDKYNCEGHIW